MTGARQRSCPGRAGNVESREQATRRAPGSNPTIERAS